jgi:hypothetical protein
MTNQTEQGRCWRKSSYSGSGNNCVEVATADGDVAVRDSKNPDGPNMVFARDQWRALVRSVKARTFDLG